MVESRELAEPEGLVATPAHEIAHIKLLGENRITVNNEPLTDLTTIFNVKSDFLQSQKTILNNQDIVLLRLIKNLIYSKSSS